MLLADSEAGLDITCLLCWRNKLVVLRCLLIRAVAKAKLGSSLSVTQCGALFPLLRPSQEQE